MVLSEAIRDYGECARHELGHTTSTYYTYVCWHRRFARWLAEQGLDDPPIGDVSASLIRRFSYSLSGSNLRPRTIRGALHALRALFAYLVTQKALTENPAAEVRLPKKDAANRLLVTDDDLLKLLDACERQHADFRCVRDRAVLAVFVFCGLRRQELLDLDIGSVNLADASLLVQQGKGQKSRTIYLCPEALTALRDWLAMRQKLVTGHSALFVTEDRRRLGEGTLSTLLEEVKAIAGLKGDPRVKPHSIRHAGATRLLRNGADLRSIQVWLGHSQLQTTALYLHTDEQQSRKIAPLAGLRGTAETGGADKPVPASTPAKSRFRRAAQSR
jgi:site-specific recombinase XerD